MHFAEIEAWFATTDRATVEAVGVEGAFARADWSRRIHSQQELADVGAFAPTGMICPRAAATAAGNAAIELAIIVALWPHRPSWQ